MKILHGIKSELPKKFSYLNEDHSSVTQLTTNKDKMSVTTALLMQGLIFCPDILGKPRNVTLYANLLITALKTNSFHESVSYLISGLLRLFAFSSQESLVQTH